MSHSRLRCSVIRHTRCINVHVLLWCIQFPTHYLLHIFALLPSHIYPNVKQSLRNFKALFSSTPPHYSKGIGSHCIPFSSSSSTSIVFTTHNDNQELPQLYDIWTESVSPNAWFSKKNNSQSQWNNSLTD